MKGYKIPASTAKEISQYIDEGVPPSAFVYSVLCNRLFEAYAEADDKNKTSFVEVIRYLMHEVPCISWGSARSVENWLARR